MNTPNVTLMHAYGTADVFFKKASVSDVNRAIAGAFLEKLALGGMPIKLPTKMPSMATSAPALGKLTSPPGAARPQVPSPLHGQMPASPVSGGKVAPDLGQFSPAAAKAQAAPPAAATAKPGAAPAVAAPAEKTPAGKSGLPWNRMLLTGGALGAGYLGLKALQSGLNFMGGGHGGPANYGSSPGGYMPPMGINGYGAPQMGSPLM